MRLREEVDVVSFENVINKVVIDCDEQVGLFVYFYGIPNFKELMLYQAKVILRLD